MRFTVLAWRKMLKIEILMDFRKSISSVVLGIMLLSCATHKKNNNDQQQEVRIQINNAEPHCGGAAPDEDVEYPRIVPFPACKLSLHYANEDGSRGKLLKVLISDSNGVIQVDLNKGKYQFWRQSKLLTFDQFLTSEKPPMGADFGFRDEACFRAWYEQADFSFEVDEQKEFALTYTNKCFTGSHPCLDYSGPFPP